MTDYSKYTVRLMLTTREGRTGMQDLGSDEPMVWDRDGDDETTEAYFDSLDDKGFHCHRYLIDGDQWRDLEASGMLEKVVYWVQRGVDLIDSLDAAREGVDPDCFAFEAAQALDEKDAEIAALKAVLSSIAETPKQDEMCDGFPQDWKDLGIERPVERLEQMIDGARAALAD